MSGAYRFPEEFHTDRFKIRRVRASDAGAIFASYAADPLVTKFLTWHPHSTVDQTRSFIETVGKEWDHGNGFPAVILDRDVRHELVGMVHPHVFSSRVNYGYVIRSDRWGQGCASEVLAGMIHHALSHPTIYRTQAFCDIENRASARVMEKAGMSFEGTLRRYSQHSIADEPRDCLMYARTR